MNDYCANCFELMTALKMGGWINVKLVDMSNAFLLQIMGGEKMASKSLTNFCCEYQNGECNPEIIGTLPYAMAAMWNNGKRILFADNIPDDSNASKHASNMGGLYEFFVEKY